MKNMNALQMEEALADLADSLVIVVESPGAFAELGAFSLVDRLRRKLLLILDNEYEEDQSFINTGPVRWADEDSQFKPAIFTDLKIILGATGALEERLRRLPPPAKTRVDDLSTSPKHLLFFALNPTSSMRLLPSMVSL
jgi:hypothetical protein